MRTSRSLYVVIGCMGLAIAVLAVLLVTVYRQAAENQQAVRRLVGVVEAGQQDERELRRLVQALQQQVRDCERSPKKCGPPLTSPPTERTPQRTTAPPTGSASSAPSSPAPQPSPSPTRTPRPRPTPHPSVSPTPTPSTSPTCLVIVCVSPRAQPGKVG